MSAVPLNKKETVTTVSLVKCPGLDSNQHTREGAAT